MGNQSESPDPRAIVEQGYDSVAPEYARLEDGTEWPRMHWLTKLLNEIEPGSSVLDLGCGSGIPADIEIAKRHKVTGVDISRTQISLARKNAPAATFIHGDLGTVQFPDCSFDAVISFYTLEHLPREQHSLILKRIAGWLRPEGYLLLSIEASEMDDLIDEWLGVPMHFSSFTPEKVKQLIVGAGFEILETAIEGQQEAGEEIPYLWVFARLSTQRC